MNVIGIIFLVAGVAAPQATSTVARVAVREQSNLGVDVVVVAHADDWQVFLGDAIVERIKSGRRPVFIYLTAGDHGRDSLYWRQRETAALQSARVALAGKGPSANSVECDVVHVGSHPIRRCELGLSESFFLRLPDGNRNGRGFARNRFESLRKLRTNRLVLHSVDSSTSYATWQDLTATVNGLVRMVADSMNTHDIVLHTTDPSARINPHDHYDHRMAGKLTETLLTMTDYWSGRYYIGYALSTRAPNRTAVQQEEKLSLFSAYDREMMQIDPRWSAYREHPRFYADCMQRTYSRSFTRKPLTARIR